MRRSREVLSQQGKENAKALKGELTSESSQNNKMRSESSLEPGYAYQEFGFQSESNGKSLQCFKQEIEYVTGEQVLVLSLKEFRDETWRLRKQSEDLLGNTTL